MDLYTRIEAATYLDVSPSSVKYYISTKRLPAFKKGRAWLVLKEDLEKLKNSEWFQTKNPGTKRKYSDDMPRLYLFK